MHRSICLFSLSLSSSLWRECDWIFRLHPLSQLSSPLPPQQRLRLAHHRPLRLRHLLGLHQVSQAAALVSLFWIGWWFHGHITALWIMFKWNWVSLKCSQNHQNCPFTPIQDEAFSLTCGIFVTCLNRMSSVLPGCTAAQFGPWNRLFCAADTALASQNRATKTACVKLGNRNLQPGVLVDRGGGGRRTLFMSKSALAISNPK